MKKTVLGIALILGIFSVGIGFTTYNSLQKSEELVFNAWADLDASLQQRADLIPDLVNTAKGYKQFEAQTLDAVVEARAKATTVHLNMQQLGDAAKVEQYVLAQQELQSSLAKLLAVVESYPDLQTNQNFLDLQQQLESAESRINFAKQQADTATRDFNFAIHKFPGALVNNLFLHLQQKEFFKADAEVQQPVTEGFSQS